MFHGGEIGCCRPQLPGGNTTRGCNSRRLCHKLSHGPKPEVDVANTGHSRFNTYVTVAECARTAEPGLQHRQYGETMCILHITDCRFDAGTQIGWACCTHQVLQAEHAFHSCSRFKLLCMINRYNMIGYAKAVRNSVKTHLVGVVVQQPLPQK